MKHRGAYPANWREIARLVKAEAGNRCERCGHPDEPPWKTAQGRFIPMWQSRTGSTQRAPSPCDKRCYHPPDNKQRMLTVHHLTNQKDDSRWFNLVALCQSCHLKVQGKVWMERGFMLEMADWFKPYAAAYFAWKLLGLELSREQVVARLHELLALGDPFFMVDLHVT